MPCAMITPCSLLLRASKACGSARSHCSTIPLRCGRMLRDHGGRTPFTSWSLPTHGGFPSNVHGEDRLSKSASHCAWCCAQERRQVPAFCNMRTLYLRNVPDEVVDRLERMAKREGTS